METLLNTPGLEMFTSHTPSLGKLWEHFLNKGANGRKEILRAWTQRRAAEAQCAPGSWGCTGPPGENPTGHFARWREGLEHLGRIHGITEKQKVEKSGGGGVGDDELNEKPKMTQERKYNTQ